VRIVGRSTLNPAEPGTHRAAATFPTFAVLADGTLLASYSIGSTKDSDDLTVELRRSSDGGATWDAPVRPFETTMFGRRGSLKFAPITRLDGDHLIMVCLWIDREAFPGEPLFNPVTEGCLPMAILLADSFDAGRTWTPWRSVDMPADVGPPSLTTGILPFPSGRLLLSIETNKPYLDTSRWLQRVVHLWSDDGGTTWSAPTTVVSDPTGRIANWDQRGAVTQDGRLVSVAWIYDFEAVAYRNIRRRISLDEGRSFGEPTDLGFTDQPGHPALLPDGRVVLAWVDRFGTKSIRARVAASIDAHFDADSEIVLFDSAAEAREAANAGLSGTTTGDALVDMQAWAYGLCHADTLPNGDVGVVHYAPGDAGGIEVRWVRLAVDDLTKPER
jgi:hypothetical protein